MVGTPKKPRPPNPCHHASPLSNPHATNPHASAAAVVAFMSAGQNANKNPSSAAAAAALRALPAAPTNVAEVRTKRTMRRSSSVSSSGSISTTNKVMFNRKNKPALARRVSSGSMTERTFRTPSPHRPGSTRSGQHAPPPPLPSPAPSISSGHHQRSISASATTNVNATRNKNIHSNFGSQVRGAGMPNFRTASQKLSEEVTSWHTQPKGNPNNIRRSDAVMQPPVLERSESRNSVNFSYPSRVRAQSPSVSPTSTLVSEIRPSSRRNAPLGSVSSKFQQRSSTGSPSRKKVDAQTLVYDPNSRRMVPKADLMEEEMSEEESAFLGPFAQKSTKDSQAPNMEKKPLNRPKATTADTANKVKMPEKKQALPTGEQVAMKREPDYEDVEPSLEEPSIKSLIIGPQTFQSKLPKAHPLKDQSPVSQSHENTNQATTSYIASATSSSPQDEARVRYPHGYLSGPSAHQVPAIFRKPSVVHEVSEEDEDFDGGLDGDDEGHDIVHKGSLRRTSPSNKVFHALDALPTQQTLYDHPETQRDPDQAEVSSPPKVTPGNLPSVGSSLKANALPPSNSDSSARTARFVTSPSDQTIVPHMPPHRSSSPMKSALKHSSTSVREGSLDYSSDVPQHVFTDPDSLASRKKSMRVSFDDRNSVDLDVSRTALPGQSSGTSSRSTPRHQGKRHWYSVLPWNKKKETALEDDEVMVPRPDLPSFGRVMDKQPQAPDEERPLVRPQEAGASYSPSPVVLPVPAQPNSQQQTLIPPADASLQKVSSDQPAGSVAMQNHATRDESNTSSSCEPAIPVEVAMEWSEKTVADARSLGEDADPVNGLSDDSDGDVMPTVVTTAQTTQPDSPSSASSRSESISAASEQAVANQEQNASSLVPSRMAKELGPSSSQIASVASPVQERPATGMQSLDLPGRFPEDSTDDLQQAMSTGVEVAVSGAANAAPQPDAKNLQSPAQSSSNTALPTTTQQPMAPRENALADESDGNSSTTNTTSDVFADALEYHGHEEGSHDFQLLDAAPLAVDHPTLGPSLENAEPADSPDWTVMISSGAWNGNLRSSNNGVPFDDAKLIRALLNNMKPEKRPQILQELNASFGSNGVCAGLSTPTPTPTRKPSDKKKSLESDLMPSNGFGEKSVATNGHRHSRVLNGHLEKFTAFNGHGEKSMASNSYAEKSLAPTGNGSTEETAFTPPTEFKSDPTRAGVSKMKLPANGHIQRAVREELTTGFPAAQSSGKAPASAPVSASVPPRSILKRQSRRPNTAMSTGIHDEDHHEPEEFKPLERTRPATVYIPRPQTANPTGRDRSGFHDKSMPAKPAAPVSASTALSSHPPFVERNNFDFGETSLPRTRGSNNDEGHTMRQSLRMPTGMPQSYSGETGNGNGNGNSNSRSARRLSLQQPPTNIGLSSHRATMSMGNTPVVASAMSTRNKSPASTAMRQTLRSGTSTETSRQEKRSSLHIPSLVGKLPKFGLGTKKDKSNSRIADSDDDDDPPLSPKFRSRYDDSSDDATPRKTRPISQGGLRGSATMPIASGQSMSMAMRPNTNTSSKVNTVSGKTASPERKVAKETLALGKASPLPKAPTTTKATSPTPVKAPTLTKAPPAAPVKAPTPARTSQVFPPLQAPEPSKTPPQRPQTAYSEAPSIGNRSLRRQRTDAQDASEHGSTKNDQPEPKKRKFSTLRRILKLNS